MKDLGSYTSLQNSWICVFEFKWVLWILCSFWWFHWCELLTHHLWCFFWSNSDSLVPNSILVPLGISISIRAVKVDMQLSFFFILEERQLKRPVAVRLYEIDEAFPKKRDPSLDLFTWFFPSTMYRTLKHKKHTSTFIKHCDICTEVQQTLHCEKKKKHPWRNHGHLAGAIVYAGCWGSNWIQYTWWICYRGDHHSHHPHKTLDGRLNGWMVGFPIAGWISGVFLDDLPQKSMAVWFSGN